MPLRQTEFGMVYYDRDDVAAEVKTLRAIYRPLLKREEGEAKATSLPMAKASHLRLAEQFRERLARADELATLL